MHTLAVTGARARWTLLFVLLTACAETGRAVAPGDDGDAGLLSANDPTTVPLDTGSAGNGSEEPDRPERDAGHVEPGDAASAGDAAAELPIDEPCVPGQTSPEQVVMIGDSFYHLTEIPEQLWENARAAGTLGAQETYRYYYLSGAQMVAGASLVTPIPAQWDQAVAASSDIRYVIMNGGGNDVLIGDRTCLTQAPPANAQCAKTVDAAIRTSQELFAKMGALGVERVLFAFYPHMPTSGLFQGNAPAINETIDYAEALARKACEESPDVSCVFVSTVAAFEGHPEYLNPGDVHASPAGSKVAADLIWTTMQEHCIAQ